MFDHKSFSTISKTAKIIGVQSHVLRFWEKKFFSINPKKSLSGRRYYSSKDIQILLRIKKLLYEQGFTIKGAVNFIDRKDVMTTANNSEVFKQKVNRIRDLLKDGLEIIKKNMY